MSKEFTRELLNVNEVEQLESDAQKYKRDFLESLSAIRECDLTKDKKSASVVTLLKEYNHKWEMSDELKKLPLDLSEVDLSELDFSGKMFPYANFNDASFANSDLTNAIISKLQLNNANFQNAILVNTCFGSSSLTYADFTCAKLDGASFCDADVSGALFFGTNIGEQEAGITGLSREQKDVAVVGVEDLGKKISDINVLEDHDLDVGHIEKICWYNKVANDVITKRNAATKYIFGCQLEALASLNLESRLNGFKERFPNFLEDEGFLRYEENRVLPQEATDSEKAIYAKVREANKTASFVERLQDSVNCILM